MIATAGWLCPYGTGKEGLMTRQLPSNPSLAQLRKQAKDILKVQKNGDASCCAILRNMRQFKDKPDEDILKTDLGLQEVQFALALEYGFKTWNELKQDVLKTGEQKLLHIHCGDSSAKALQESKVPGDVLVWKEIYVEGPVPGNLSEQEFQQVRASFLSTFGLRYEGVLQGSSARYRKIKEAGKYEEVILWFDACLFDQTIMIHLIDLCARQSWEKTKLSLICVGYFAGFGRFCGLGELSPEQLASLFDTRHEVTQAEIKLAGQAWKAFTSANPLDIENLLQGDCSVLPYLKDALLRHLQQFPSVHNGLNRLENQILAVVASGVRKLGPIFSAVSNKEERPFFGDTSLWSCINQLASCKEPLLRVSGPNSLSELTKIRPGTETDAPPSLKKLNLWDVDITDIGKEVLAGLQDAIMLSGIDRWLGGVHLQGACAAAWRWDLEQNKIIQIIVNQPGSPKKHAPAESRLGPIGRLNDDVRERLSRAKVEQICERHGLPKPKEIIPEPDGNDTVVYYLDENAVLSFHCHRQLFADSKERLIIAKYIEEFLSPRLIAAVEKDADLGMPYIITERCPGMRLDRLWSHVDSSKRLLICRALGYGMGRYHTIGVDSFKERTREVSLYHRHMEMFQNNTEEYRKSLRTIIDGLGRAFEVIDMIGLEHFITAREIEAHLAQCMERGWQRFSGPGLTHEYPWPDHFFIQETNGTFRLSGCIDFEGFPFRDSLHEISILYLNIFGLDDRYEAAFISGYEEFIQLPENASQRILEKAIEVELNDLMHMTDEITGNTPATLTWRETPAPKWLKRWIRNRLCRLEGWFIPAKRVKDSLFRRQVGPW